MYIPCLLFALQSYSTFAHYFFYFIISTDFVNRQTNISERDSQSLYFRCLFLKSYDVSGLLHCYAISQSSNTSNSHKMACSHHFIPFSLFGVSISINCLFVQAQTQFILLTLTSYSYEKPLRLYQPQWLFINFISFSRSTDNSLVRILLNSIILYSKDIS